jgi:hypothetical protein
MRLKYLAWLSLPRTMTIRQKPFFEHDRQLGQRSICGIPFLLSASEIKGISTCGVHGGGGGSDILYILPERF